MEGPRTRAFCFLLPRDVKVGKQARQYAVWLATVRGCPYNGARRDPVRPAVTWLFFRKLSGIGLFQRCFTGSGISPNVIPEPLNWARSYDQNQAGT